MRNKLRVNANHFPDEGARINEVLSRLGGSVAEGVLPYLNRNHPEALQTIDDILDQL